jgi:hypothetical protein
MPHPTAARPRAAGSASVPGQAILKVHLRLPATRVLGLTAEPAGWYHRCWISARRLTGYKAIVKMEEGMRENGRNVDVRSMSPPARSRIRDSEVEERSRA